MHPTFPSAVKDALRNTTAALISDLNPQSTPFLQGPFVFPLYMRAGTRGTSAFIRNIEATSTRPLVVARALIFDTS